MNEKSLGQIWSDFREHTMSQRAFRRMDTAMSRLRLLYGCRDANRIIAQCLFRGCTCKTSIQNLQDISLVSVTDWYWPRVLDSSMVARKLLANPHLDTCFKHCPLFINGPQLGEYITLLEAHNTSPFSKHLLSSCPTPIWQNTSPCSEH